MPTEVRPQVKLPHSWRRVGRVALGAFLPVFALGLGLIWVARVQIADRYVANALEREGIAATYNIERIGVHQQVLSDIVIGDPARPDFAAERAVVILRHRFGLPEVIEVRLVRPRLFGTWQQGSLSFGDLDPLIFNGEKDPFEFPDVKVFLEDGRALLESDYGPVGIKIAGSGPLRGGFAGEIAVVAPRLVGAGCDARGGNFYASVAIQPQYLRLEGPLRFERAECTQRKLVLENGVFVIQAGANENLTGFDAEVRGRTGTSTLGDSDLAALAGTLRVNWQTSGLTARYDLIGTGLTTPRFGIDRLAFAGLLRTDRDLDQIKILPSQSR